MSNINKSNDNTFTISIDNGSVDRSNNKLIDNTINKSKEINKSKIIPKSKNKEKRNRNILPPQEKPTFENGKFANKLDESFNSLVLKPEIFDISFIRPNLEKLYKEGNELVMYAYVDAYRQSDNRYVLYNLCSESLFLSDHVLVDPDEENEIETRVGQCIRFIGSVYKYGDKYSISPSKVTDLEITSLRSLHDQDIIINNKTVKKVFKELDMSSPDDILNKVNILSSILDTYSAQIFGTKRFIIGMIFDFYFMRTRNVNLSNNEYNKDLDLCKYHFLMIFSDIIFRIESGLIFDFKSLQTRVLQLCMIAQSLPVTSSELSNQEQLMRLSAFCATTKIDIKYTLCNYTKSIVKRYKLKKIKACMN